MSFQQKLEFGNYTLNFGADKYLLDLFQEIVFPSFEAGKFRRGIKDKSNFFFIDTKLVTLELTEKGPVVGIVGRLVKDTVLRRDQIYDDSSGIVPDVSTLKSAPTSTFLLILNNHRLVFCREVSGAPTLKNFESTSLNFIRQARKELIDKKYQAAKKSEDGKKITKKELHKEFPSPALRITPLTDSTSLRDFINRFEVISHVSVKLLNTNHEEINNDDFWKNLNAKGEDAGSKNTTLTYRNSQDGLNSQVVFSQADSASKLANSELKINGKDIAGDKIKGNNDDFSLTADVERLPQAPSEFSQVKFNFLKDLVESRSIILPKASRSTFKMVKKILRELNGG